MEAPPLKRSRPPPAREKTAERKSGVKPGARRSRAQDASVARQAAGHSRIRQDHSSEIAEDYVELIAQLIAQSGEARTVDLAARLGVSHVTVTKTLARLQRDGLIRSEPYRSIFLTDSGQNLAQRSRERHALVVEFLCRLGVSADTAELDAEGIEHHVSDETLQAMRRLVRGA